MSTMPGASSLAATRSSANMPVTASARQGVFGGGTYEDSSRASTPRSLARWLALLDLHRRRRRRSSVRAGACLSGPVYTGGPTGSANFPVTPGAYDTTFNTGGFAQDAFVARYDVSLSGMASKIYCTLHRRNDRESLFDIAVDLQGRAHVVGQSRATDFPLVLPWTATLPISTSSKRLSASWTPPAVRWCSRRTCRRNQRQRVRAVAVNANGETYVAGTTNAQPRSRQRCPTASR